MENSRLFRLLRTLSKREWLELKKFVRTPFFNQRSEVIALLDMLEKSFKTGRAAPEKTQIYRGIFSGEQFDDHRVRMAMSFLYKTTAQFLAVRAFLDDEVQQKLWLAKVCRRRDLPDHFALAHGEAATVQESRPLRNADFFEEKYQLLLEKHRFAVNSQPGGDFDLQTLSDNLDAAFIARKLWQSCFMMSHQTVSGKTYQYGLLDAALSAVESEKMTEIPAIGIYFHCYRALTRPSEPEHFRRFKALLAEHAAFFPDEELRDLYILAVNFCIRQYNAGSQTYLRDQFDLYREGLARRFFLTDGALSHYTYQNIATVGLVMHELDWVENFVREYRELLKTESQESLFSFNLARIEYLRRHLDKALRLLQKADYKDLLLSLAAKTLQLKIFYELEEFDLLESHLGALQAYINRKKVIGYHRENYLNTVLLTRKLLETNLFDKNERAALRAEIENTKSVAEKEWLLERVA